MASKPESQPKLDALLAAVQQTIEGLCGYFYPDQAVDAEIHEKLVVPTLERLAKAMSEARGGGGRFRILSVNDAQWLLEPWLNENIPEGWTIVRWVTDPNHAWQHTIVIQHGQ